MELNIPGDSTTIPSGSKRVRLLSIKFFLTGVSVTFTLLVGDIAIAHSGGLNSQGCHAGSQPYHCHRSPSEMIRTKDGRNRLRCDLGSRSYECLPNTNNPVKKYQQQLIRHCPSLPHDFADGNRGFTTLLAIIRFQVAYSLYPTGHYGPETARALNGPVNGLCR